jgi:diacylglycerol kinase
MPEPFQSPPRTWYVKFRDAFRGLAAVRTDPNILVHLFLTVLTCALAALLSLPRGDWCLLILCITLVIAAEMLNTSLEQLAKALGGAYDPHIRDALDISAGAVLLAGFGAIAVGCLVFLPPLWQLASSMSGR